MKKTHKQSGHAGLTFICIAPILLSITAITMDGSRAIQANVRLGEAIDSAVLAISSQDSKDYELVENYIQSFVPEASISNKPLVELLSCDVKSGTECIEYSIEANISLHTWFPYSNSILGFDEKLSIYSTTKAQKEVRKPEALDVILITDVSNSMQFSFDGNPNPTQQNPARKHALFESVNKIVELLSEFNKENMAIQSKLAIIPFHEAYATDNPGTFCMMQEVVMKNNSDWDFIETVNSIFFEKDHDFCSDIYPNTENKEMLLTNQFTSYPSKIENMYFGHTRTEIIHALIRGAQVLSHGNNNRRIYIIITDGDDNEYVKLEKIIDEHGLCENIKKGLSMNPEGAEVDLTLSAITINSNLDSHRTKWLELCLGKDNIYNTTNHEQFIDSVLDVVTGNNADTGHYIK